VNVVRNRADGRWLPSRFDFALFRLFAYFRLKTIEPEETPGLVLSIERHQSAIENYMISFCVAVVLAAFLASILDVTLPLVAACLLALPATAVLVALQIVMMGSVITPLVRKVTGMSGAACIAMNSILTSAIAIAAAILLAVSSSPLRHIGTAYLLLLAANAVASVLVFLMRRPIADLERKYGVEP
jgi:O-antigen/teichoic acid export membrane protein